MADLDWTNKVQSILNRHGGYLLSFNSHNDRFQELNFNAQWEVNAQSYRMQSLDLSINFTDSGRCEAFFNYIVELEEVHRREAEISRLHIKYPTLKDAYEQYQILLKLYQP